MNSPCKTIFRAIAKFFGQQPAAKMKNNNFVVFMKKKKWNSF